MRLLTTMEAFLRDLEARQCSPLTIVAYRADLLQFIAYVDRELQLEHAVGAKRARATDDLAQFTPERIRAWQASLSLERKLSATTVRKKLHALASFAKFCVRASVISRSPLDAVVLPKARTRVRQGIPLEVWRRVLALPLSARDATIRGVLAWAGLRRGEVLGLRPVDLRLGDSYPTLCVRGKGDKERVVPVPPPLRDLLLDYCLRTARTGKETLFQTDAGREIAPTLLTQWVKRWGRDVGFPSLHPHLFRHTYASGLIASGVPIDAVQAWLGHASLATTATYLHTAQSVSARAALDGWTSSMTVATHTSPTHVTQRLNEGSDM
jgi:integrase/recombinase XerC